MEVTRSAMCDHCSEAESCVSYLGSGKKTIAVADNSLGAREGDLVELAISEGVIFWGTVNLYLIPIIFLLVFIIVAFYLNSALDWNRSENVLAVFAGLLGLLVSLPVVRLISTRWKYLAEGRPKITRIMEDGENAKGLI